ncbi:MAG TPA: flavodoxin domain-containing protein [Bacteroidales bacterium]|nr:flavodoxin domain-containing protein [Bacteroidales bacterium]
MKISFVFSSRHGTTEKITNIIASHFNNENIDIIDLKKIKSINIKDADIIILGASIHAGRIQKEMKKFCLKNISTLQQKHIALFICRMFKENEVAEFENAYPEVLRKNSIANGILGGELLFEKMNFIEKFLVKKIAKINNSVSDIDNKAIEDFINKIKSVER